MTEHEDLKSRARLANAEAPRKRRPEEWPSRREFLLKLSATAGVIGGATYLGLAPHNWPLGFRDPTGDAGKPEEPKVRLHDFRVEPPQSASVLGIARGKDYAAMLRMAVGAIGGIEHYIRKGDVVVIKPNVAFDRAPRLGATTNPQVLSALIRLVREAGAAEVRVADSPIESPESCFHKSGIREAALNSGAEVYLPAQSAFEMLEVPGARLIEHWPFFYRPFRGANKVIGIAPLKDHNLCRASMTTKNWYGLLGGRRNQFHQDIHHIVADLALMMRPTFVILDASRILMKNGPTGGDLSDVVAGNTLVAATDQIAADSYGYAKLLNRNDPPAYLRLSGERNLGNPDWQSVRIKEEQVG
jgi:uncharacterized protein (DUF362 family)